MSHGSSGPDIEEPNLIPLLDLVLQMVMFFMACANFAMENVNAAIKLPVAQSARPIEETGDVLYLNVDEKGRLLPTGSEPLEQPGLILAFIKRDFAERKQQAATRKDEPGKVKTLVILRAHKDANFKQVYEILRHCKTAGFTRMQLRAQMG
jgi:biopolymer transport protein ExbD